MAKSIVAGINMDSGELNNIASSLGCVVGDWPLNYLGLPLGGNPNSSSFWDPVVERVSKRLEGWHKSHLSRGGRLTLLQSVLGSIPIYYMSIFKMPIKVAAVLEKMLRNFFWEGRGEGNRNHLVNWKIVSKPKILGGLGVGNLINKNSALLGKWLWRFPLEKNSLWHSIIASRHGIGPIDIVVKADHRATLKSPWKSIAGVWEIFVQRTEVIVGKGDKVKFWEDCWIDNSPLCNKFPRLFRLSQSHGCSIQSFIKWNQDSGILWDFKFFRNLNDRDCEEFASLMSILDNYHFNQFAEDRRVWKAHHSRVFSCKSFLDSIVASNIGNRFPHYKFIWKNGIPTKIKIFVWLAVLGKVNTLDKMQVRMPHFTISPSWCVLCKQDDESANHLLLHCEFSRMVWSKAFYCFGFEGAVPFKWADFISIQWQLKGNSIVLRVIWNFFVHAIAWLLWMERNRRIFEDICNNANEIWSHACFLVGLWAKAANIFSSLDNFLFSIDPGSYLSLR